MLVLDQKIGGMMELDQVEYRAAATRNVLPEWVQIQTLKTSEIPGYVVSNHIEVLDLIWEELLIDRSIASGKLNETLRAIIRNPGMTRSELTNEVFNGNSGYTLQLLWPISSIFAGLMPARISVSTAKSYSGWVDRIGKVAVLGKSDEQALAIRALLDRITDAYAQAVNAGTGRNAEVAREVEDVSSRVDVNEPGIYVFTTLTYLAYPPFGWDTEDRSRLDFRYLKTGSSSVDVNGRIQTEIRRQTGLPEPYIILAKFKAEDIGMDYVSKEKQIHRLLGEARHGPEDDGTRRGSARGAGTEWFITRLPFVIAVAESLGLDFNMSDDFKSSVNETLEACELPDWIIS